MYYIKDVKNNIDIDFYLIRFLWYEIEFIFFSFRKREIRLNYYNYVVVYLIYFYIVCNKVFI